ncbi:MAG: BtrH N-terminal domain-containing protein [Chitinivibrionales bacterium]
MSDIPFHHAMAAHCESGSVAALLNHAGLKISEPMIFGISAGIFFAYLKIPSMRFPVFAVRSKPGDIRRNAEKRLGVTFKTMTFRDPVRAQKTLEELLKKNIPVAVQVDMFYMEYIPAHLRTHFNAHFIVVFGKGNGVFHVSDCYYPTPATIAEGSLESGRFAKGDFAPRGLMFYSADVPTGINLEQAVLKGIRSAARNMLKLPIPFIGIRGIRMFSKKVASWPTYARNSDQLSHEIMKIHLLLEEQGTGGGGFRFMYATFLQEASKLLNKPALSDLSRNMMANGDKWREISVFAARIGKNRDFGENRLRELSAMIAGRADEEEKLFTDLLHFTK